MKNNKTFKILLISASALLVFVVTLFAVSLFMLPVVDGDRIPSDTTPPEDSVAYNVDLKLLGATTTTSNYTILAHEKMTVIIDADEGYYLPSSINVTGATFTWSLGDNAQLGTLVLSKPTGNISVSITAYNSVTINCDELINVSTGVPAVVDVQLSDTKITANGTVTATVHFADCELTSISASPELDWYVTDTGYKDLSSFTSGQTITFCWNGNLPSGSSLHVEMMFGDAELTVALKLSGCSVGGVTKS